jgi:hypothetical protein
MLPKPISSGFGDRDQIGDTPASRGDGNFTLGWVLAKLIEGTMNLGCDVGKGGRDQLLIDLVEVHYFEFSSIARLDEMLLFGGDKGNLTCLFGRKV